MTLLQHRSLQDRANLGVGPERVWARIGALPWPQPGRPQPNGIERPPQFVTRKITAAVARIALGHQEHVTLGTLATRRDWGWAPDYVDGMVRAARHDEPLDVVLATGRTHTIGEFADAALHAAGVEPRPGLVRVDAELARPTDATEQCGDASLARTVLGWGPSIGFEEIVRRMVVADLALLADGDAQ